MKIRVSNAQETMQVGKLLCIGRNYADHAKEMNADIPTEPMIFLKPSTALIRSQDVIVIPPQSQEVHHEVELVVLIGKTGKHIPESEAMAYVAGYAVGLDMTARDLQAKAKKAGAPWSVAKGFDTFAPLGEFAPPESVPNPHELSITLRINGEVRQSGRTSDMIFSIPKLIAYASTIFTLEAGDLLYTGTPEGVGAVHAGDALEASVTGLPTLQVSVVQG